MARSSISAALVSISCLLAIQAIHAALPPPTFDPALIVEDIGKDCPVKNVPFDKSVFNADDVANMPGVLQSGNVSQACQNAATTDLIGCFGDLQIMTGCCSKDCAAAVEKNIKSGCFAQYQKAICANATAVKVQTGLFYAAKRCGNFEGTCGPATAATAAKTTNTTTAAAAASNTSTATNATKEALPATGGAAAARSGDGTSTSTTSTAKNGAESQAVSTVVSFVAAVVNFVLVIVC